MATQEALVGSFRPRIVKLHGSFPDRRPFIITKEDYRSYPRTHAAFVNTVQQSVMECSLCLLGFGGNDPNFLAWTGWVHDNLGETAPPIYLVGVLDLNSRSRTILERRRVVPIDLGPAFPAGNFTNSNARHRTANEWFLLNLGIGEPDPVLWPQEHQRETSAFRQFSNWDIPLLVTRSARAGDPLLADLIKTLEGYPGWLSYPQDKSHQLDRLIGAYADAINAALAPSPNELDDQARRDAAFGAWTAVMTIQELRGTPLPSPHLTALGAVLDAHPEGSDRWYRLALQLMTTLRWTERWAEHEEWQARLEQRSDLRDEYRGMLGHEIALRALDRLDYAALQDALASWSGSTGSFGLELARASILAEIGEVEAAVRIVHQVLRAVRSGMSRPGDPSIASMAIEGAAIVLLRVARLEVPKSEHISVPYGRMAELSRWDCDPDARFNEAERQLHEAFVPRIQVRKTFDS